LPLTFPSSVAHSLANPLLWAQANPALNYVGIEVYEAGIGRLINSAHIKQLNNLKVMRGDAVEFLSANIADNSLARFQLFFPDPWHKKKHHKRRIVQQDFLNEVTCHNLCPEN
jgi:tRNA (guanine-N7-)-methyltransferase